MYTALTLLFILTVIFIIRIWNIYATLLNDHSGFGEKRKFVILFCHEQKQGTEILKGGRGEGCWKDGFAWGPDSHYPHDGSQMPLNSSSKESDPLFQTLWPLYTGLHTYTCRKNTHTKKNEMLHWHTYAFCLWYPVPTQGSASKVAAIRKAHDLRP